MACINYDNEDQGQSVDCLKTKVLQFLKDLTDPEMYGHAVSSEVRVKAAHLKTLLTD